MTPSSRLLFAATLFASLAACSAWRSDHETDEPDDFVLRDQVPVDDAGFELALYQTVGARLIDGNETRVVHNGDVFDVMVEDIANARSSVHILMYIWAPGRVSDRIVAAIAKRRRRSPIACRILVDTFGSGDFEDDVAPDLERAGCDVKRFRSDVIDTLFERNHRKIVVVDGRVGMTGGFGIRDDWDGGGRKEGEWRDTSVRVRGPVVRELQRAFAQSWIETTGELLPSEAFPEPKAAGATRAALVMSSNGAITDAQRLTHLIFKRARERLWIANAYFVPSDELEELLGERAAAGVDVRLLTSGSKSDSKFAFASQQIDLPNLEEEGVRAYEYQPTMMHAKTVVVDDTIAVIGSINLEPLSLQKLEEVALVAVDEELNARLARDFVADLAYAEEEEDD